MHCLLKSSKTREPVITQTPRHGIQWSDGYVHYEDGLHLLKNVVASADVVYVKGLAHCRIIYNLTKKERVDLEAMGIASAIEQSQLPNPDIHCFFTLHRMEKYACALQLAQRYKYWLIQRDNMEMETSNIAGDWDWWLFSKKNRSDNSETCTEREHCIPTIFKFGSSMVHL